MTGVSVGVVCPVFLNSVVGNLERGTGILVYSKNEVFEENT